MNILGSLKPNEGSKHYQKRLGRGRGSGLGQTSGKGHKGQLARTGGKVRRGFEGGQSPLVRRLPKFGFSNFKFEDKIQAVNISHLTEVGDVSPEKLFEIGLLKRGMRLKLIGNAKVSSKLNIKTHAISKGAKASIEAAGGTIEVLK